MTERLQLREAINELALSTPNNGLESEAICSDLGTALHRQLGLLVSARTDVKIHYEMGDDGRCERKTECSEQSYREFGHFKGFTTTLSALDPHIDDEENRLCMVLQQPLQDRLFTLLPVREITDEEFVFERLYNNDNGHDLLGVLTDEEADLRSLVHAVSKIPLSTPKEEIFALSDLVGSMRKPIEFCSMLSFSGYASMVPLDYSHRFRIGRVYEQPCLGIITVDIWGSPDSNADAIVLTHNETMSGLTTRFGLRSYIRPPA